MEGENKKVDDENRITWAGYVHGAYRSQPSDLSPGS